MEPPFPLHPVEEEAPITVEDLKSGSGKNIRDAILNTANIDGAASPDELLRRLDKIEKSTRQGKPGNVSAGRFRLSLCEGKRKRIQLYPL